MDYTTKTRFARLAAIVLLAAIAAPGQLTYTRHGRTTGSTIPGLPNPTHSWNFNDCSGSILTAQNGGQNGTIANMSFVDTGGGNCAGDFNGTTSIISAGTILDNTQLFSATFWLQADSRGENLAGSVLFKANSSPSTDQDFRVNTGGGSGTENMAWVGWTASSATFERWNSPTASLAVDGTTWAFWAVSVDCASFTAPACIVKWYKDGSLVASASDNNINGDRVDPTGWLFSIGNRPALDRTLDARLDDLRIFEGVELAGTVIAQIHAGGRQ